MNRHGSMNRIYRLVWSQVCNAWVPVAETAKGRGKSGREQSIRNRNVLAAAVSLALAPLTQASPSATPCVASGCAAVAVTGQPAGGRVVSGIGRITQSGSTTDIQQSSQDLTIDWLSFSIGSEQTVNFLQPSAAAVAVNQILSANGSQILGHLNANGQVWLINPNGVLFGRGAEVDVGGLVASTLEVSDASPSGTARGFGGAGTGSVVNQGTITAANGGYVALLGNEVGNQGVITAKLGTVALGAGGAVTLTFDGSSLVRMQVDQSSLNDLAANGGLIAADGGRVMMTAGARDALLASVVNNTGVIQARTVQNHAGTISLLGGMMAGTVNVGGTLDASAPQGGNGGFIETSAAHVEVANAARVTSLAAAGKTGTWLIDPTDFTVAPTGGDISGATLGSDLNATNFTLLSSNGASPVTGGGSGGNINVNDTVSWSANTTLTLTAANNVNVNGSITASGATAGLAINPNTANGGETASGTGTFNLGAGATVNLPNVSPTSSTALVIGGTPYTVINSLGAAGSVTGTDLQGLNGNPAGYYALGSNINATATSSWNGGAGFTPIGNSTTPFSGIFDGLGHTISSLTINLPTAYNVGLFGYGASPAVIRNVGLIGASVTGEGEVGGLVGGNIGTISNSHATGSVSGATGDLGGLVGFNNGTVSTSYAAGTVSGSSYVGGLVGYNAGSVNRSYAAGAVSGASEVGGLVGGNVGTISNSYASGSVSGSSYAIGGLVGYNASTGTLTNSYATGSVSGPYRVGGLVGYNDGLVNGGFATGTVGSAGSNSSLEDGGLVGYNDSAGTIINSYATGSVSGPVAVNAAADGGLVGGNAGTVSNSYATGGVSGYQSVGGLVGGSSGTIDNSYATGLVNGSLIIGGLVGGNSGSISNSYAMGGVSGVSQVGGLVGYNLSGGKISNSNAAGSVNGSSYVGGLVGYNGSTGTISYSFATGSVSGAAGADYVGGLVGDNAGAISNSNAAGSVNGSSYVGGLVGYNGSTGTISYSFATGSVSGAAGADYLGGLVGDNAGTISNSYAAGTIQAGGADYLVDVGGAEYVGGLVGYNTGSITNSSATGSMTAATGSVDLGGLVGAKRGYDQRQLCDGLGSGWRRRRRRRPGGVQPEQRHDQQQLRHWPHSSGRRGLSNLRVCLSFRHVLRITPDLLPSRFHRRACRVQRRRDYQQLRLELRDRFWRCQLCRRPGRRQLRIRHQQLRQGPRNNLWHRVGDGGYIWANLLFDVPALLHGRPCRIQRRLDHQQLRRGRRGRQRLDREYAGVSVCRKLRQLRGGRAGGSQQRLDHQQLCHGRRERFLRCRRAGGVQPERRQDQQQLRRGQRHRCQVQRLLFKRGGRTGRVQLRHDQ
jgi:trimeric autotransporter adhesin